MPLDTFQLGEPVEHRGIVVTPLFPRNDPVAAYITLDEALPRGFHIDETSDAGSVPELVVENPNGARVLLYDGEELVGAKQDRILNVSVLVEAGAKLPIPVSCVEQGRWHRRSAAFSSADHISHSHLRRRKAQMLAAQPLARGAAQGEVWAEVNEKQSRMRVASDTSASRDTFEAHRASAPRARRSVRRSHPGSAAPCSRSATTCASTRCRGPTRSRSFGRSSAPATCSTRSSGSTAVRPRSSAISSFVDEVAAARATRGPSAGLGEDVRMRGDGVIGSGLDLDGETIQLSAFTSDDAGERAFGRIARPSRRR